MAKVILFDLGGVVFRDIYSGGSKDFAAAIGLSESVVLETYRATDVPEWPEGKISDEARWALFVAKLGLSQDMVQKCAEAFNVVFAPIPEVVELLEVLDKQGNHRLGVLSDQHPGAVRYLYQRYGQIMNLFDPSLVFISSKAGLAKHEPDRRFFYYAISHSGVGAAEILFVDDSAANIAYGDEVGMTTYFFDRKTHSSAELATDLRTQLL